ncbi:TetR/AcrR family transcriptional regulator [Maledivibacter halophilus]|uniref:Transcriptional regulator, TetR family n=1 Tax=Maledivibacter halophilus TaxID=36842 RepID=A0A1T5J9D9_9FIRM|nr:TetR/AcrR family transcriptional regulator [Maledivibacter halophilus]SKC48157.1 transcriptional regulator, TetR family [Maledivibacter halophilus]
MSKKNKTSYKIMEVALKLFSEQGYYSTTTKQIAKEAKVNELTVFRHFKTKENLFQETTQNYVREVKVDEIVNKIKDNDFDDNIRILSRKFLDLYFYNIKLYKVQMKLADKERKFIRLKLSREIQEVLINYFEELAEKGEISGDPKMMAATFVNSILGAFTVYVLTNDTFTDISIEKMVDEHAKQFSSFYQTKKN